jgi:hypothetical protein
MPCQMFINIFHSEPLTSIRVTHAHGAAAACQDSSHACPMCRRCHFTSHNQVLLRFVCFLPLILIHPRMAINLLTTT